MYMFVYIYVYIQFEVYICVYFCAYICIYVYKHAHMYIAVLEKDKVLLSWNGRNVFGWWGYRYLFSFFYTWAFFIYATISRYYFYIRTRKKWLILSLFQLSLVDLRQRVFVVKFLSFYPLYKAPCPKYDLEIAWHLEPVDGRRMNDSGAFFSCRI